MPRKQYDEDSEQMESGVSGSPGKSNSSPSPSPAPSPRRNRNNSKNEKNMAKKKPAKMAAFVANLGLDVSVVSTKKKNCNCKNSRCLKLYCECFASGQFCDDCNCIGCCNNPENESLHREAVAATLERNPAAFQPKIAPSPVGPHTPATAKHYRGCNCKKSGCLKKYCECYQAGILCGDNCKCCHCKNYEDSSDLVALRNFSGGTPNGRPSLASPPSVKKQKIGGSGTGNGKVIKEVKPKYEKLGSADFSDGMPSEGNGTDSRGSGRTPFRGTLTPKIMSSVCELLLTAARDLDSESGNTSDHTEVKQEDGVLEEFNTCVEMIVDNAKKREELVL